MRNRLKAPVILLALATMVSAPASAQGWIEASGVTRDRTSVTVEVKNQVATVEVEEWFRNRGGNLAEGDYLYPLPTGAVFSSYSLFQGDKEMRGEVLDAKDARRIYEDIVRRKKDPALIELVGHGLVRARVFPIGAGETRRVVLRYTQTLQRAGDALEFRYSANRKGDTAPVTFTLTAANAAAFRDAVSPTHELRVTRERGRMIVRPVAMHDDLALLLPFSERDVGIAMSTYRGDSSEDGFFMLRLSPGDVAKAMTVPRDVSVVVDVSGSMAGEKMIQAKAALRQLLGTLGANDRFRLIKFSSASDPWREEWTRASSAELREANRWVDELRAEGGTNIGDALADAFSATTPSNRLAVVVFMTDGVPSVGEQNPERIAAIAEKSARRSRVFAFGVGHDVNTYLLDRLGAAGRGGAQYVQPGESVETALSALSSKIQHPVLTDLVLNATGVSLREVYPTTLPDLFSGEDLVVFGRYRAASQRTSSGAVTIRGERGGKTESYSTQVTYSARENGNDYIPRLWASRKLGELSRRVKLNGYDAETIAEIKSTALRYGLLSEYTSYFVAEPGAVVAEANRIRGDRNPLVPRDQVSSRSIVTGETIDKSSLGLPTNAMAQVDVKTGGIAAAYPPAAATGAGAVASAEADRLRREASNLGQVQAMEKDAQSRIISTGRGYSVRGSSEARIVGGRTFTLRESIWESIPTSAKTQKKVDVVAFSDAYFALIRALPELKAYTELGKVAVAGDSVTIRLLDSGVSKLTDEEIAKITLQFRGAAIKP